MFSDRVLEELFKDREVMEVPLIYRSAVLHGIYDVLERMNLLKEGAKDEL